MKRIALASFALALSVASAFAQNPVPVPATRMQIPIAGTVAASTRIVTGISGSQIIVTGLSLIPVATSVVTFTYGTGTNCGTGTTSLTGAMTFAAGQTLNLGAGYGGIMVLPQGNDLCITIATAAAPGFLAYAQYP